VKNLLIKLIRRIWVGLSLRPAKDPSLDLGTLVIDGEITRGRVAIPHDTRSQGIAIRGRTGTGKSFLNRHLAVQDIRDCRGFMEIGLHGDTTPFLLSAVAARERVTGEDFSQRLILIDPDDPLVSVAFNPL